MKLQKMLEEAAQQYYTTGQSSMSDAEFDMHMKELSKIDPDNAVLTAVGHGYDVYKDNSGRKVKHKYGIVGSLPKCHNWKEYTLKDEHEEVCCSLKLDGISCVMYYIDGVLDSAITRGNGTVGIDITNKVKIIEPSYSSIADTSFTGAVRGEILMKYSQFDEYVQMHPEASHPRNTAAGIVNNSVNMSEEDLKRLDIVVYTVVGSEQARDELLSYKTMNKWLRDNFAHTVPYTAMRLDESTLDNSMNDLRIAWYNDYPSDGVVISRNSLAIDSFEISYDAISYKYEAESCETEVIDVEWRLSKSRYLIPRINVKTVNLSGADISWATGFHAKYVLDNNIGPGAVVQIMRSNEVIPDIQKIVKPGCVKIPDKCPSCSSPLIWSGVHLKCPNTHCEGGKLKDLLVWMNTICPYDGLGDKLKIKFLEDLGISGIDDLYRNGPIVENVSNSVQYNNFRKMFNMLFSTSISLKCAIRALNIPRFGDVNSAKLAKYPEVVKQMMYSFEGPDESFRNIIGEANFAALKENCTKFNKLQYVKDNIVWDSDPDDYHPNREVVITGKLSVKRAVFEEELREFGFTVSDTIKKTTFALVTDNPNGTSSKNRKAETLEVPKLTEDEFRSRYL